MTRDYKPAVRSQKTAGKGSVFFAGLLLGLIIGVGASVGVAIFVKGGENPFSSPTSRAPALGNNVPAVTAPADESAASPEDQAPANRFDFYKILPGNESQVTEQEIKKNIQEQQASSGQENYYLQVGAFKTEEEADNTKAKLALLGLEAVVQTANLQDKGVWHRVRVGPYTNLDQISKARAELTLNGFKADLIKIHSNVPDQ